MKLSARNVLKGTISAVVKGVTTAHVKIDVGHGVVITSSITVEAAKELKLKKGDEAYAIIKATEVIVGKD
jgi:molybdopterin-binding protein